MMIALKDAINSGLLGKIVDFDAWLALDTPWSLWKFLENLPKLKSFCTQFTISIL